MFEYLRRFDVPRADGSRTAPGATLRAALALLLATSSVATAMGVTNQANYNDGKPGSPMQCRTFENDSQGTKCARFCAELKQAAKEKGTYCMCLPGSCEQPR